MLPSFIIPGPPKSGTTSLQFYLDKHPEIFVTGETHFFSSNYDKGIEWYKNFFRNVTERVVGEKSPSYFFHPEAPKRIKKHIPNTKLIFIFRNPVDRAYSHYWHEARAARENAPFEKAIKRELDQKVGNDNLKYLEIGKYILHLKRWKKYFQKSQMFFLTLEELNKERLKQLLEFLEVDKNFDFGKLKKYNIGGEPRSRVLSKLSQHAAVKKIPYFSDFISRVINMRRGKYPAMKSDTRRYLLEYFDDYNQDLEKFTGLDLSKWRK